MSKINYVFDDKRVSELPSIDIAYEILKQTRKTFYFNDLAKEISEIKGIDQEEMLDKLSQLYTEINIDGRFVHLGDNEWGLKSWYPLDKAEAIHFVRDDDTDDLDDLVLDDEETTVVEAEEPFVDEDVEEVDYYDEDLDEDFEESDIEDQEEDI
ncbi:DNA-directed RNA polymerase subunit delta [Vulcanibacillus modesticaldus]|uniref:Probable DNA-directed RNA polymerase subunit delta n=1 Tax=Vulcanibacillus modesticaldus TaxID=337097 RepID=A0A1D2YVV5_9BACI|nr:DNA-directed RNA polymerase subunit delta [Vulcanibacillus modesticaldus]OEF99860.1 DNA-directed RNA polymerase subunit delta [Vulcanibacillus modesticaldus]